MKNKQHTLPSFYLISSAVDGNENAIEKLLLFYEAYISKCCLRPFYDEYGNVYIVVDMELKGRIREALFYWLEFRYNLVQVNNREEPVAEHFAKPLAH